MAIDSYDPAYKYQYPVIGGARIDPIREGHVFYIKQEGSSNRVFVPVYWFLNCMFHRCHEIKEKIDKAPELSDVWLHRLNSTKIGTIRGEPINQYKFEQMEANVTLLTDRIEGLIFTRKDAGKGYRMKAKPLNYSAIDFVSRANLREGRKQRN